MNSFQAKHSRIHLSVLCFGWIAVGQLSYYSQAERCEAKGCVSVQMICNSP